MKVVKKKWQGILRIVMIAVISLVLGFAVYGWNAQNVTGNQMPMPFGIGIGWVKTGSMQPELNPKDLIVVVKSEKYKIDDIVVYQRDGVLTVHKIIAIEGDRVTTQGTANNTPDDPISVKDIKGKVWFHIDGLGGVVTWMQSSTGTFFVLLIAGSLLVYSYMAEDKEKREEPTELEELKKEIELLKTEMNADGKDSSQENEN